MTWVEIVKITFVHFSGKNGRLTRTNDGLMVDHRTAELRRLIAKSNRMCDAEFEHFNSENVYVLNTLLDQ